MTRTNGASRGFRYTRGVEPSSQTPDNAAVPRKLKMARRAVEIPRVAIGDMEWVLSVRELTRAASVQNRLSPSQGQRVMLVSVTNAVSKRVALVQARNSNLP